MKLKKIEINGFKSFADKTQIHVDEGITCIVGPNGCGKSNVVDVTKWILGEQSIKSLRGKEMTDVIFNGTASRRAMGYAEATMTISNENRLLPFDMDEIQVTRKVHRSGEGEYYINQKPARLKDVKELFMDTGVGTRSYSVMEQGQIESFINASSKDRRKLFEEAAGVSRYKSKKEEASRKLEKVEQNLLRINDVIDEVEKQLRSVTLQAQKARRYQSLVDELKKFRISHSVLFIDEISHKRQLVTDEISAQENAIAEIHAKLAQADADIAQWTKEQLDIEHQIQEIEGQRAGIRAYMTEMDTNQSWSRRNIQDLISENALLQEEINGSNERSDGQLSLVGRLKEELTLVESTMAGQNAQIAELEGQRNALQADIKALVENVDERKQSILRRVNEKIRLESEAAALRAQVEMLQSRQQELKDVGAELEKNLSEILVRHENTESQILVHSETKKVLIGETETLRKSLVEAEDRTYSLERELSQINKSGAAKEGRLQILQDLESRNEGLSGGVKAVLEALKGHSNIGKIRGIVADLFTVDAEYALAIEIFLGFRAQDIVTDTALDAKKAIEFLKAQKRGRCTFLPLDRIQPRRTPDGSIRYKKGVIGLASELVSYEPEYANVMSRLLGHVFIVDTIDNALELSKEKDLRDYLVTLDGEVFSPDGAISGGVKREASGLVTRKNEILALVKEMEGLRDRVTALAQEYNQQKNFCRTTSLELDQKSARIQEVNIDLSRLNVELNEVNREKEKVTRGAIENKDLLAKQAEVKLQSDTQIEIVTQKLSEINVDDTNLEDHILDLEKELRAQEQKFNLLNAQINALKIESSSSREKKQRLEGETQIILKNIEESKERMVRDMHKLNENTKRKEELEEKIKATEKELNDYLLKSTQHEAALREVIQNREKVRNALREHTEATEAYRRDDRKFSEKLNESKMKLYEIDVNANTVKDRIWGEYRINVDEFLQQITPEELEEIRTSDFKLLEESIEASERKIKNIGPVNIDAIQEQSALEERFNFLTKQRNDLVHGKNSLSEVINEINVVSRELFIKTFEEVRNAFQEMFRRLFGGGRADIILQEGVDVLEAGIEIFAKPPGKENRSISLLSGGEKVMTTISLLFAVFKTKPSPFCILDEIDAALDEANIDRFMAVLQEFLSFTQFIIITHNPRTMSMADEIYGVTMEEKGVSKVFTMKVEALTK